MINSSVDNITGEIVGEITEELKISYAKELARIIMEQYDKEYCKKIIDVLIEDV